MSGSGQFDEEADSGDVWDRAERAFDAGDFAEAARLWGSLTETPAAIYNAGNAARAAGALHAAEAFYLDALERGIKDAYLNYANLLLDSDRRSDALRVLVRGIDDGDAASGVRYAAEVLESDPIESERVAQRFAGVGSWLEQTATLLVARARRATDPLDSSIEALLRSVSSRAEARLELAYYLVDCERFDEAQALLSELLEAGDPAAGLPLANLLWDERDDAVAAEATYRRAIALGDNFSRFNLGLMLWDLNRNAEGKALIHEAAMQGDASAEQWLQQH